MILNMWGLLPLSAKVLTALFLDTVAVSLHMLSMASVQPRHLPWLNQCSAASSSTVHPCNTTATITAPLKLGTAPAPLQLVINPHPKALSSCNHQNYRSISACWGCEEFVACRTVSFHRERALGVGIGTAFFSFFFRVKKGNLSIWPFGEVPLVHRLSDSNLCVTLLWTWRENFICSKKVHTQDFELPDRFLLLSKSLGSVFTCGFGNW